MMMVPDFSPIDGGFMKRFLIFMLGLTPMFFAILDVDAGGEKPTVWTSVLPDGAFKELSQRSIQFIEASSKSGDKGAKDKIEVEAAILVGYTLSVKNPKDEAIAQLRGAAIDAAKSARANEFKNLTAFGKSIAVAPKAPPEVKDWKAVLHATEPMMKMFLTKAKGGEGIHVDLQYHPSLKNLNGIEALISKLAAKQLSEDSLAKVEKELPNLAYRVAVIAAITREFAPKKDVEKWRDLSHDMQAASLALADAANKKNGEGVLKAALALENSCVECHSVFKSNK
jgi:hypothetical protein